MRPVLISLALSWAVCSGESIIQKLNKLNQYSQFTNLLKTTEGLHKAYLDNYVTVFAPTNNAMNSFGGVTDENFILHHMVSSSVSEADMGERLTSLMQGHPPLWVRLVQNKLYVNQARVIYNYETKSSSGKKQFLYLIDSVLEPLVPKGNKIEDFVDIKAGNILKNSDNFRIGDNSVKKFYRRVQQLGLEKFPQFTQYGKMTFFLPVDSAFSDLRVGTVDEEVVRAHVVPEVVLFTKPQLRRVESYRTVQYNTSRDSSDLRVMAKVDLRENVAVVESITTYGTKKHKRGSVRANIVKANIPVQNGIVHLIDRPLVVMANTLYDHLCVKKIDDKLRFTEFSKYLQKFPLLCERIRRTSDATILVPTNEAFKSLSPQELEARMTEDGERIIGLHYLDHPPAILADDVRVTRPQADSGMYSEKASFPANAKDRIWFWTKDGQLRIDGGGVDVEVVEANIGASNGVIHSINRVLGIPVGNIHQKLEKDPMMSKSYTLGTQEHFNLRNGFNKTDMKFTYLVPSDQAWEDVKKEHASAYKILFMGDFYYQAHHVLERHLKVGDKMSLRDMISATQSGTGVEVMRGPPLQISTSIENGETVSFVNYDGITSRIVRPNIECTNGYIHLIDKVVMKRRDITLGASAALLPSVAAILCAWAMSVLLK